MMVLRRTLTKFHLRAKDQGKFVVGHTQANHLTKLFYYLFEVARGFVYRRSLPALIFLRPKILVKTKQFTVLWKSRSGKVFIVIETETVYNTGVRNKL